MSSRSKQRLCLRNGIQVQSWCYVNAVPFGGGPLGCGAPLPAVVHSWTSDFQRDSAVPFSAGPPFNAVNLLVRLSATAGCVSTRSKQRLCPCRTWSTSTVSRGPALLVVRYPLVRDPGLVRAPAMCNRRSQVNSLQATSLPAYNRTWNASNLRLCQQ